MREGARRFGWERRPLKPATLRDGRWLIGLWNGGGHPAGNFQMTSKASVRMGPDGIAVVQSDMTDIGTGTYTIVAQVRGRCAGPAARSRARRAGMLGLSTRCGFRRLVGRGKHVHGRLSRMPRVTRETAPEGLAKASRPKARWPACRTSRTYKNYSIFTYGAHFAEVGVDIDTAEIRLRRMLGVFAAGRILNAKTARSQMIGGMTWGASSALLEDGVVDTRSGRVRPTAISPNIWCRCTPTFGHRRDLS
jgi:xanthine dehydrogenase YagR molybdenum-binding subunit